MQIKQHKLAWQPIFLFCLSQQLLNSGCLSARVAATSITCVFPFVAMTWALRYPEGLLGNSRASHRQCFFLSSSLTSPMLFTLDCSFLRTHRLLYLYYCLSFSYILPVQPTGITDSRICWMCEPNKDAVNEGQCQ